MQTDRFRILLIGESLAFVRAVEEPLQKAREFEYDLQRAKSFKDGLERLERGNHDVILLEWTVVKGDGASRLAKVRELRKQTPIVVLSSRNDPDLARRGSVRGPGISLQRQSLPGALRRSSGMPSNVTVRNAISPGRGQSTGHP